MIGHYLGTLTTEQEDRVLTTSMKPGHWQAPCLMGVVHPWTGTETTRNDGRRWWIPGYGLHAWTVENGVATDYDALCRRFGASRVNNAIRNRILSNRARRTLRPVSENAVPVGLAPDKEPQT